MDVGMICLVSKRFHYIICMSKPKMVAFSARNQTLAGINPLANCHFGKA